jgi:hypothetical protein
MLKSSDKLLTCTKDITTTWHIYNVNKDSFGNKLLKVSVLHYNKWKPTLMHREMLYLSPLWAPFILAWLSIGIEN